MAKISFNRSPVLPLKKKDEVVNGSVICSVYISVTSDWTVDAPGRLVQSAFPDHAFACTKHRVGAVA
jgi:hypothetical protein